MADDTTPKAKADTKPEAKKPAASKPVAKPVSKPVERPVAKKPAAKPASKPVAKKPVAKKPVAKKKAPVKKYKASGPPVNVYSLSGNVVRQVNLPSVFLGDLRPDLIRRAVKAAQANRRQAYGPAPDAGMKHAASQWGKGRGVARVQRMTQGRTAVESPPNVGGRRAHPPRPEKDWSQKINKKEKKMALNSALAALMHPEVVRTRGHRIDDEMTLPLVIEDGFEELYDDIVKDNPDEEDQHFTKETMKILRDIGLEDELDRSSDGKHIRAGKGTMRGRRYKRPKGILFVVLNKDNVAKCVRNIPGVDIVTPARLNIEHLAPGGDPGRLTVFTEGALMKLGE